VFARVHSPQSAHTVSIRLRWHLNPPRRHLGLSGLAPLVLEAHVDLPILVVDPADLVRGRLHNGRRRLRTSAPRWAGRKVSSDSNGEAAHITHAPMRPPLRRTAQVSTEATNPALPPARMCGGPARPTARGRLRENPNAPRLSALALSAIASQAPLQLGLRNRPSRGAMSRLRCVCDGAALATSPVWPRRPRLRAGSGRCRCLWYRVAW